MTQISRRSTLAAAAASIGAARTAAANTSPAWAASRDTPARRPLIAYVGSRTTTARDASGTGITAWRVPQNRGRWEPLFEMVADDGSGRAALPANPSFLVLSPDQRFLYTVHGDLTFVSAFAVDGSSGALRHLNTVDTGHANPVHLAISPDGSWLVTANFAVPGDLTSFAIRADGSLGPVTSRLALDGERGRVRELQEGSNPHQVVFDPSGRFLHVPNRGLDAVHRVTLDSDGTLRLAGVVHARPGDGPRHMAFDARLGRAYVVNEISASVTTHDWDRASGVLTAVHNERTVPGTDLRNMTGAGIAVDRAGIVYSSNRSGTGGRSTAGPGPDSVSALRPTSKPVGLHRVATESTVGQRPRFLTLTPDQGSLVVANELSHTIVTLACRGGGNLGPAQVVAETGSPVSVVFLTAPL